jgi:hypothetical protein
MQALRRGMKHDTAHAIMALKCKKYSFLILGCHGRVRILIIDDER